MTSISNQLWQREENVEVDVYLHPSFCEGLTLIAYRDGTEITCTQELRQIKQQIKETLTRLVIPQSHSGYWQRTTVLSSPLAHSGEAGWGVETIPPIPDLPLQALAERIRSYLQLQMLTTSGETLEFLEHMVGWTIRTPEGLLVRLHLPTP